jgi:hypothetical protein
MNKFLLFAGENYYPSRGWGDFIRSYENQTEAIAAGWAALYKEVETFADRKDERRGTLIQWWSVVDVEAETPVESSWDNANSERAKQIEDEYNEPFGAKRPHGERCS